MNLGGMRADLRLLTMGNLSDDMLTQFLNRAQSQCLEAYDWSFLHQNVVVNSAAPKTNGSITVSKGSPVIIGTDTTFGLEDVGAFVWIGGLNIAPLPIIAVQGLEALTLASPWPESTIIQGQYSLSPLYYLVPGAFEVLEVRTIVCLSKVSRLWLNDSDPARIAQGGSPSTNWCDAPASPDGSCKIELWPVPADARPYLCDVKINPPTMVDDGDVPLIPYELIESKALVSCCQALYGATAQSSWMDLAQTYAGQYAAAFESCKHADARRTMSRNAITRPQGYGGWGGFDAKFTSEHDLDCPP